MYTLRLTPDFARQRELFLREKSLPEFPLPPELERTLEAFAREDGFDRPRNPWWGAFRSVRGLVWLSLAQSFLVAVTNVGATLVGMEILKLNHGLWSMLGLSTLFFALNVVGRLGSFWSNRSRGLIGLGVKGYLAALMAQKTLRLSSREASLIPRGNLKVLISSDVGHVGEFFDNAARNALPSIAALAIIMPVMSRLAGGAGLLGVAVMLLILLLSSAFTMVDVIIKEKVQARMDEFTSLIGEWVKNVRLIRFLSWQDAVRRDVAGTLKRVTVISGVQHFLTCLFFGMSWSWWMLSVAAIAVSARALGIPLDLVSFFGSMWLILVLHSHIQHVPNTIRLFGGARVSMRRIEEFLEREEQSAMFNPATLGSAGVIGKPELPRPVALRLEDVGFEYEPGKPVLHDLTLRLGLGEKVSVIGAVASGKTTLLRLLSGELSPTRGTIRIECEDGSLHDYWEEWVHARFREELAFVPQEPFVSNHSVKTNILLSEAESEYERDAIQAAALAELDADIRTFESGYAQEIGENGVNLSGGQKQRLNLARAFASKRPYFLLDDPLSAVDVKTEALLMEQILAVPRGFVLVSHRVGELMRTQRILVLESGRVVEDGEPASLRANSASYFNRVLEAYSHDQSV